MHSVLLWIHILGAGYVGVLLVQTMVALWKNYTHTYNFYARQIALMLVVQVVSGCLLLIQSHQSLSAFELCSRFGLYFFPTVAIEIFLFLKMNAHIVEKFPTVFVVRAFCLSLFITMSTIFLPLAT